MTDKGIGEYYVGDLDDDGLGEDDEIIRAPIVVPSSPTVVAFEAPSSTIAAQEEVAPAAPRRMADEPARAVEAVSPQAPVEPVLLPASAPEVVEGATREQRLVTALDELMEGSPDIQAAALVSLDGFTMASALPDGMEEDRVGAMSAAILGLGERAAAELGRGRLSQVFIEGSDGYVLLMAAGDRAVLTALAHKDTKLGLVLYDMRASAARIGDILA